MENQTSPIQVYIENARDERIGGFTIPLPITKEALAPWLMAIEASAGDPESIVIRDVRSSVDNLAAALRGKDVALDELNYLAAKIREMDPLGMDVFLAALEGNRHTESIAEIIGITENFGAFDLQPAFSEAQYGDFLLEEAKNDTAEALERLEKSNDPIDRKLAAHVLKLESLTDEATYGLAIAERENGVFTQQGYLTKIGEFREVYRGSFDIPREYRLFDGSQQTLLKAAGVELAPFLMKLHATAGEYMHDAEYNLEALCARKSDKYLLLLDGKSANLTAAISVYECGTSDFDAWMNATEALDTKAFAIHITEAYGRITGDVEQLDLAERKRDIADHSIHAVSYKVIMKNGEKLEYAPAEWDALSLLEKDRIQNWRRMFKTDDHIKVFRYLDKISNGSKLVNTVSCDELLAGLNAGYMEKSKYPQDGFLRVSQDAAKEILARGDAEVFRLMPGGAERLEQIDVVKSGLWFSEYREFAVRRDDLPKLDKWAERAAGELLRQSERGAHQKSTDLEV
jgi:hypothetical protein